MLKFLKFIILLFTFISLIFVIHVFVFKALSKAGKGSRFNNYPLISSGLGSESYVMNRLFYGLTFGVWYDTVDKIFIISAEIIEDERFMDRSRHLFYLDAKGELIKTEKAERAHYLELESNKRYAEILRTPEKKYTPEYRFSELDGVIKLEDFQKEQFTWPYFYYFFPVVLFDWQGTGFVSYTHNGEDIKFKIPMKYYSRVFYLDGNYDGQLYYYPAQNHVSDIAFFEVSESSYSTEFGSGRETHREGFGLYVIQRK